MRLLRFFTSKRKVVEKDKNLYIVDETVLYKLYEIVYRDFVGCDYLKHREKILEFIKKFFEDNINKNFYSYYKCNNNSVIMYDKKQCRSFKL